MAPAASNHRPAVAVIVPAYGVANLLQDALGSLLRQTFQDWEAIVVDDGAPDDVAGAVAPFLGDPRIRLMQTDNGGLPTARNRAIAAARAPLVANLDGDDAYQPRYLERMVGRLHARPELDFVTCDAWFVGDTSRPGRRFSEFMPQDGPLTLERVLAREVNVFVGVTMRKAAWQKVGGYDANLKSCEDLDLWVRLLQAGCRGEIIPEPLVDYRVRRNSMSNSLSSMNRMFETAVQVYDKFIASSTDAAAQAVARKARQKAIDDQALFNARTALTHGRWRQASHLLRQPRSLAPHWRAASLALQANPALFGPMLRRFVG